ncbi:hypothetical protein [Streptomyces viridochromogenes]|uniref:P-type ATPase n=1 Tax=Streptomyces viridochromogenes TaxID=1938 RepID=UPI0030B867D3
MYAQSGSEVYAGTLISNGSVTMRATSVGQDTVVGRIITRAEEAQADRAPIQTVATAFTRRFVPVSFALAGITYVLTRRRPTSDHHAAHRLPLHRGPGHPDRDHRCHRQRRPLRHSGRTWPWTSRWAS